MPNIYLRVTNISKAKGKCCVAACAYRTGLKLHHEILGIDFDFRRKTGIKNYGVILPEQAPSEFCNPEILWNSVERVELKNKDSNTAKEITIALDNTLSEDKAETVIKDFSSFLAAKGMCVTWAIHDVTHDGKRNLHAHLMTTVRPLEKDGTWGQKEQKVYKLDPDGKRIPVIDPETGDQKIGAKGRKMWQRELQSNFLPNTKEFSQTIKPVFADIQNKFLPKNRQRTSKSYEEQQITGYLPEMHVGVAATAMHRKHKANPEKYPEESEKFAANQVLKGIRNFFLRLRELSIFEKLRKQAEKIKEKQRQENEKEEVQLKQALDKLEKQAVKIKQNRISRNLIKQLNTLSRPDRGRGREL